MKEITPQELTRKQEVAIMLYKAELSKRQYLKAFSEIGHCVLFTRRTGEKATINDPFDLQVAEGMAKGCENELSHDPHDKLIVKSIKETVASIPEEDLYLE
jgi:hypothetical protein